MKKNVIIEGFNASGKSTILDSIPKDKYIQMPSRGIPRSKAEVLQRIQYESNVVLNMKYPKGVIFNRFTLISEYVYGFANDFGPVVSKQMVIDFFKQFRDRFFIVFCRTPYNSNLIQKHLDERYEGNQHKRISRNIPQMLEKYQDIMDIIKPGIIYDFNSDTKGGGIEEIKEMILNVV